MNRMNKRAENQLAAKSKRHFSLLCEVAVKRMLLNKACLIVSRKMRFVVNRWRDL